MVTCVGIMGNGCNCATCSESERVFAGPDPYAEHRLALDTGILGRKQDGLTETQREARKAQVNGDAFDRLAATRRAKLEQAKQALDRPATSRHPECWPEGASEEMELYVS